MSADSLPSPAGATLTRAGVAGWAAWSILVITLLASTAAAALERRSGVCGTEGLDNPRTWVFRLVPLGQTCAGESTVGEVILHGALTAAATFAAMAGISVVLILLGRRLSTGLPPVDGWLLYGVAAGIVLGFIAWVSRAASGIPYSEPDGASLSMTFAVSVAFGVGLLGTALAGVVVAAIASSGNSESRQTDSQ